MKPSIQEERFATHCAANDTKSRTLKTASDYDQFSLAPIAQSAARLLRLATAFCGLAYSDTVKNVTCQRSDATSVTVSRFRNSTVRACLNSALIKPIKQIVLL